MNCHPAGDRPLQGNDSHPHIPHVRRGDGGMGVAGLHCNTCHQAQNVDHASLPGHPAWHLAPIEMAWHGRSLAEICAQIKDPERNGGKTLAELQQHMAGDSLVGWGWQPGAGREPAPGDQATFGDLIAAWIDTGAHCRTPERNTGVAMSEPCRLAGGTAIGGIEAAAARAAAMVRRPPATA